jgi:acyl carrier protein
MIEDIKNRLAEIFRDVLDNETIELTKDTTASDIDEWDSLGHISLLVAIEKEFKIKFTLPDVESLRNVGDMIDLIRLKVLK